MAEVTWFKVLTDIFADDKIKIIQSMPEGDSLLVMWFKVLSQAGKTNDGGYIYLRKNIPYTAGMLATLFNKPQMLVEMALKTFSQFEMIDVDDNGYIFVTNWEKHQNIEGMDKVREQNRIRNKNYRDKKRLELMSGDVTRDVRRDVTGRSNDAIEVDIDLDLNITTTTPEETIDQVHSTVFGKNVFSPLMTSFISNIRNQGYKDRFITELMYEAGETSNGPPSLRYMQSIFDRWKRDGIYSREQSKRQREKDKPPGKTQPQDKELEYRRIEIARNKWIAEGNDPSEFVYNPGA